MNGTDIEAITFDCYGTLIDWESGLLRAMRPILAVRGVRCEDAEVLRLYAAFEAEEERTYKPYRDVLRNIVGRFGAHFGFEPEDRERDRLPQSIARWEPFQDTIEALRALASRFTLVVCSNIDDDLFEATREKLEAGGARFDWVVTAQYCRSYKPDARHFRVALALLGLPADRVLHAAQSRYHDIAPARRLGFRTAWVNRPSRCPGTGVSLPVEAAAEVEVRDLAGLVRVLGCAP
jgi:2-haloacid dehalogenase